MCVCVRGAVSGRAHREGELETEQISEEAMSYKAVSQHQYLDT